MNDETQVAESSTAQAAEPINEPREVEDFSEAQRDTWLKTGELPSKEPISDDSATSKPGAEKPGAKKAESGTAKQEQPKRKGAQDRKQELSADIQDLLEKRGVLKAEDFWKDFDEYRKSKDVKKADSSPAPETKAPAAKVLEPNEPERPKRPLLVNFNDTAEYEVAMDKYDEAMLEYPARKQAFTDAKAKAEEAKVKLDKNLRDGMARVNEKYPDAKEKSNPILEALLGNAKEIPEVTWFLNNTEILPDMLYALGGTFKLDEFLELGKSNPAKAIRILASMEAEIISELEKKPALVSEEPKTKPKVVTSALPPPREIGGKGTPAADEEEAALKAGDTDRYMELANKREIAARKAGRR